MAPAYQAFISIKCIENFEKRPIMDDEKFILVRYQYAVFLVKNINHL
jgi:hypothetical protein